MPRRLSSCLAIIMVVNSSTTKTIAICVCALGSALSISASAAAPPVLVDERLIAEGKMDIRPEYPAEAQAQRLTGSGVFVLHVDCRSGLVRSVEVQTSTGHKILDDASITVFRNLRFKPDGASRVKIPVTFTMPSETVRVTRNFPAAWLAESGRPHMPSGRSIGRK